LIAQRKYGELAGKWEFAGGKVKPGETPEESLKRELLEELNVEVKVLQKIHENIVTHGEDFRLLFYYAQIISGKIKLKEHSKFQWVLHRQLHEFDLLEGDKCIIEILK